MSYAISSLIGPVISFLLTIIFGIWMNIIGRPYNTLIFTFHKITALFLVIFTTLFIRDLLNGRETGTLILGLLILAGLLGVVLFATGALMSVEKWSYDWNKTIHAAGSVLIAVTAVIVVLLLS